MASFVTEVAAIATMFEQVPNLFTWPADPNDDHIFNLAIRAQADFLVTWETRMLRLANDSSESGALLRQLAPQLRIVNPEQFAYVLKAL